MIRFSRPLVVKIIFVSTMAASLSACERYAVTLNQQPIYTPPPLYSKFTLADEALMTCVKQTIVDQNVTAADKLTRLSCSHAGVRTLDGLEHFAALEELDVSFNKLQDISIMNGLKKLRVLKINDNPALSCDQLAALKHAELTIIPPVHCVEQAEMESSER